MADPLIEQLRPLGLEKYAGRLTRIVSDAMQVRRRPATRRVFSDVQARRGPPDDLLARANVSDQAALQVFRDRARKMEAFCRC